VLRNELGCLVQTRVISSQAWVPQPRERAFLVGFPEHTAFGLSALKVPKTTQSAIEAV